MLIESTRILGLRELLCLCVAVLAPVGIWAGRGGNGGGGKDGGGGKEETPTPCVTFGDSSDHGIRSDGLGSYCDDRSMNTTVTFTNDGHLSLNSNSSNKTGNGRNVFIDFGTPITVVASSGASYTFTNTDELASYPGGEIQHDLNMHLAAFEDSLNLLAMSVGETRVANLTAVLFLHFPGTRQETPVFIKLAPNPLDNERYCAESDGVAVECTSAGADGQCNEWSVVSDGASQACVSAEAFGSNTHGLRTLKTSFVISYGPPASGGGGGASLSAPTFVRGDCDGDGRGATLTDAIKVLGAAFAGDPQPACPAACDANGDGDLSAPITDAIYLLAYAFGDGAPPPAPFPSCGALLLDSDSQLGCEPGASDCR